MAVSTCIKCGNAEFESKPIKMAGEETQYVFIQCNNCGGVVGLSDVMSLKNAMDSIIQVVKDSDKRQLVAEKKDMKE